MVVLFNAKEMSQGHPKGLYLLFATEMWERFSYYGMRALLVLYLTKSLIDGGLGFTDDNASLLYGFFTGFVYFTPLIGGWLADNYLGQRKAIVIGAILMMLGQFSLATESSLPFLYTGLVLLIIGNGFFKPNISVIVGHLYEPGDPRKDSAFTIFYMGINVGAFFAPLLTGYMALTYGYRYGFMVAGIGMLIGLLVFTILGKRYLGEVGNAPSCKAKDNLLENVPLTREVFLWMNHPANVNVPKTDIVINISIASLETTALPNLLEWLTIVRFMKFSYVLVPYFPTI